MKKLLMLALFVVGFSVRAEQKQAKSTLMDSDTVVWTGLDYSLVRMIGTNDFNIPDLIFPGMLEKWNTLFLDERIERVSHTLGRRVLIDLGGVTERNSKARPDQIILKPGSPEAIGESHIKPEDIATAVKSYRLDKTNGLGLVFIVDRLVERHHAPRAVNAHQAYDATGTSPACGAVYIVFFDVATRPTIHGYDSSDDCIGIILGISC